MANLQLFDSSVLIPWLRSGRYDSLITGAFESRRFILCSVVWMELYAGTQSRDDKRDLDRMVEMLSMIGRVIAPEADDFYTAGQMISYYIRQYGHVQVRDHNNDVLITLCASRSEAELVTVNKGDMERWQTILKHSRKNLVLRPIEEM